MKRVILAVLLLTLSIILNAGYNQVGFVRSYFGVLTDQEAEYAVFQNTFDWRLDYRRGNSAFLVNPVFNYNGLDDELEVSLRQAYFDIVFDNFDLRLGKQQIIWGKADGVFITDVISPRNLSEFILPDFEEIRIAINAAKLNYYLGNSTFEAVWIPSFQATILPASNSIWAPASPDFPMPVSFDYSKAEVENKLSNSEVAFKYSYMGSSIDLEVIAAYMWDDNPAMYIYPQLDNTLKLMPEHHRLPLTGASFSKIIGGAVVRSEGAFYFDKRFASENLLYNGISKKNYAHYLIGYDHNWFDVNVSFQFIQEYILDYDEEIRNDEFTNTISCLATKTFLRETLELSFFAYFGLNKQDMLLRPKLSYDISDGFNILLGTDIFVGDEGNFGQYSKNDMVFMKVRYDFRFSN
ncbi:MAG: hypothetical protein K8S56_02735 [Candidatus Cloacimonetes bacterium]|nr:hypothetical protein [Candidatus Cloacimonadota bacterium]